MTAWHELVRRLTETPGPSGYEHQVRDLVASLVADHADEVRTDALGNLIVRKGTRTEQGKRIMLAAHMDEIGLMVSHIDERGYARFVPIGGVRPITCIGGRVRFLNGAVGVIGVEGTILAQNKLPTFDDLYLDVGATSAEAAPVQVGDVAAFERPFVALGDRWVAKAMDDRIGVAVLVETLRRIEHTPHELYFVFSVQEEVGLRGATTAAYALNPDLGIAVDVTGSGDTPKGIKMAVELGKGPAIKVRDGGMLADPRVVAWMVATAERAGLPYQREVLPHGTTDARAIQLTRAGVPAGTVSIPCRYVHSPSEMVDGRDVEHAVALLVALLSRPVAL